jgi:hypothetical protein
MQFVIVCILLIVGLAVVALIANWFDKGEDVIEQGHDCSTCVAANEGDCKIHCLIEEQKEKKRKEVYESKTYDELWDPDEDIKI